MKQKIISQGAEAKIILKNNIIIKNRIKKSYRIPELDKKIRKKRTKSETKILKKASNIINSPKPIEIKKENQIQMPYIKGKRLSQHLNKFELKEQKSICKQIGELIAKLHKENIIHGDLTTSNIILQKEDIHIIDFGLGFQNGKYEDKAVDIHLFRQALEAKHFNNWKKLYKEFLKSYKKNNKTESEKVLNQLNKVEKRGRYKH